MQKNNFIVKSSEECMQLGESFSKNLKKGSVFGLIGDLSSGKTTFVKGFLKGLDFKYIVSSPTFTLINNYDAKFNVNHVDFYREPNIKRWNDIGFTELMYNSDIMIIEWADLIPDLLPEGTIYIKFEHYKKNYRKIFLI